MIPQSAGLGLDAKRMYAGHDAARDVFFFFFFFSSLLFFFFFFGPPEGHHGPQLDLRHLRQVTTASSAGASVGPMKDCSQPHQIGADGGITR